MSYYLRWILEIINSMFMNCSVQLQLLDMIFKCLMSVDFVLIFQIKCLFFYTLLHSLEKWALFTPK